MPKQLNYYCYPQCPEFGSKLYVITNGNYLLEKTLNNIINKLISNHHLINQLIHNNFKAFIN